MADIQLKVDGKIYRGWTAMQVQRGIEQAAGAFALGMTERWPGQPQQWPIEPGAECQLLLDEQPVITGYVDSVERQLGSTEHSIKIVGRDKAADIIDCSALMPNDKTGTIRGQTLLQAANLLSNPMGVVVRSEINIDLSVKNSSIEDGESVWDYIERQAREKAVLIISDGKGGLVITRAGNNSSSGHLVEGKNILTAKLLRDDSQRFSRYVMRGQDVSLDASTPEMDAHPKATAIDSAIKRERTLLLQADGLADGVTLRDRIRWERNIRRARSRRVTVTVQGWSANDRVWQPNEMVQVQLPTLGIDGQLLIVSVSHTLDQQGSRTELLLSPKEAYELLPESAEAEGGGMVAGVSAETMELLQ